MRYIVTVNQPMYVGVEADNPDMARGIAADYWDEQRIAQKLNEAVEDSSWYVGGDADLFDSDDIDVGEDESRGS